MSIKNVKEYRVVCSQERLHKDVTIDIVPANSFIHEMIFATRQRLNPKAEDLAGSVTLYDTQDGKPYVSFANVNHLPKNCELYKYYKRMSDWLTPKIIETFNDMRARGLEANIDVKVSDYYRKYDTDMPNNNKGEELIKEAELIERQKENHVVKSKMYAEDEAKNDLPRFVRFQREYSGD